VFLGDTLGKPILLEGPAGTGKTELAKAVAVATGARLVRLQCYEGLDEARALYEWNYRKQLLRIQSAQATSGADSWSELHDDIFSEEFLLSRPLLTAIRQQGPTVLLVDETDKADVEVEGLLLEVLSDFQVTVPELGTIAATHRPFVVLTSNATRELSEALKRRCLYAHVDYPDASRELAIVMSRVPDVAEQLAVELVRAVRAMRAIDLRKAPSVAETIDWARAMQALGVEELTDAVVEQTLGVVLKHQADRQRVREQLGLSPSA
jgi:MoxR-like ATPase